MAKSFTTRVVFRGTYSFGPFSPVRFLGYDPRIFRAIRPALAQRLFVVNFLAVTFLGFPSLRGGGAGLVPRRAILYLRRFPVKVSVFFFVAPLLCSHAL